MTLEDHESHVSVSRAGLLYFFVLVLSFFIAALQFSVGKVERWRETVDERCRRLPHV